MSFFTDYVAYFVCLVLVTPVGYTIGFPSWLHQLFTPVGYRSWLSQLVTGTTLSFCLFQTHASNTKSSEEVYPSAGQAQCWLAVAY